MANGLLPLAARVNIDPALRLALVLFCDMAEEREDGRYVAVLSAMALAAMLSVSENAARKLRDRLRVAGYIERGVKQSEWIVKLPGKVVINDLVRRNYVELGGAENDAPTISKRWRISRKEKAASTKKPAEKAAIQGHFDARKNGPVGALSKQEKRPYRGTKKAPQGHFQNALYIGVNSKHAIASAGTDASTVHEFESRQTASAGGRLAEDGSPAASQQTGHTGDHRE